MTEIRTCHRSLWVDGKSHLSVVNGRCLRLRNIITRHKGMTAALARSTLTLEHFLLRGRTILLYRNMIRASRGNYHLFCATKYLSSALAIPDPTTRREIIQWFRVEFERNRHLEDKVWTLLSLKNFLNRIDPCNLPL